MSVILITEHDENIYNITKDATTYHKKAPRYKSIFHHRVQHENKCNRNIKSHETMGRAREPLPKPSEYLKKNTWKPPLPTYVPSPECEDEKTIIKAKKMPTPLTAELLKEHKERFKNSRHRENHVIKNIKNVLKMKPKEPMQRVAIERQGETKELSRGLEPQFIFSKKFGKTPSYLQRVLHMKQKRLQEIKDKTGTEQPKCRYITREERENLLAGLKQNWEELQQNYQGLPILTDTIPKKNRKSKMESDLKQLEKDIVLIERHPYIYVYDDDDLNP